MPHRLWGFYEHSCNRAPHFFAGVPASRTPFSETVGPTWSHWFPPSLCCPGRVVASQGPREGVELGAWASCHQAEGTWVLQEAHRNCGLAEDRVPGLINPPMTRQMCPTPLDMAPPWPPCQSA